eukprot:85026-Rhodomonas_salina.3
MSGTDVGMLLPGASGGAARSVEGLGTRRYLPRASDAMPGTKVPDGQLRYLPTRVLWDASY